MCMMISSGLLTEDETKPLVVFGANKNTPEQQLKGATKNSTIYTFTNVHIL